MILQGWLVVAWWPAEPRPTSWTHEKGMQSVVTKQLACIAVLGDKVKKASKGDILAVITLPSFIYAERMRCNVLCMLEF